MKNKLLQAALLVFLCVIWLFPFQMQPGEWGLLAGAVVSYLCLLLIPQRVVAFAAAGATTLGMSIYSGLYFAGFAPGIAACAVFFSAVGSPAKTSLKKDGMLLVAAGAAAVCAVGGAAYAVFSMRQYTWSRPSFARHTALSAAALLLLAVLFVVSFRRRGLNDPNRKNTPDLRFAKLAVAFAAMLLSAAPVCVFYLRLNDNAGWSLFSVFLCGYTAFSLPNAAFDVLLRRNT